MAPQLDIDEARALSQISVGILSWNRPPTLRYALKSYSKGGLLKAFGEVILFANASHPREIALAEEFGLALLKSPDNIVIGPAFLALAKAVQHPNFLFLENDWLCIEPSQVARRRLAQGVDLLQSGQADAVRYRHRKKYGHSLYSSNRC